MTREVKILVGVPGSGKSYWAKREIVRLQSEGWVPVTISRDAVRFRFLDDNNSTDYFAYEDDVFKEFIREINEVVACGFDYVIVDATHISHASRMKLLRQLRLDAQTNVTFEVFNPPLEVVLFRNAQREGRERVPVKAIKSMKEGFAIPTENECMSIKRELGWKNKFSITIHEKED